MGLRRKGQSSRKLTREPRRWGLNSIISLSAQIICTDWGAPEADRLAKLGLKEGIPNRHQGQGTANRRFFFDNAMLELLWVCDQVEATRDLIQPTRLWERWIQRGVVCPFGLCLRPTQRLERSQGSEQDTCEVAFPSWDFCPPYLPPTLTIAVGTNSDRLDEPMLFQTPFGQRPDQFSPDRAQPLDHPVGWRQITRVEVILPHPQPLSAALQSVMATGAIGLRVGDQYGLELGFDHEQQHRVIDCRPELPLVLMC